MKEICKINIIFLSEYVDISNNFRTFAPDFQSPPGRLQFAKQSEVIQNFLVRLVHD